ncbi:response regulator [Acaryochloris sp. IP29b_bin.137]|uniref:hybrid sensor histidine kinase/response regulator n=1 Tax=Acaryochloris sp. IP29b_bin.137 TaxID=2969217 RepID=UPI00260823D4|nr:response regulator [Acaryochloris sp. IP29b_bin.137]
MSKILVIEDQDDIRSIICEILSAEKFNVIEAEDGHIGVLLAQEELPDLVICDIMMPEFDGYSVMTQLRQNPYIQSVPFIFLTAKASKTDLRLGMELGANDYLTKPFTRDELLEAVNAQVDKLSSLKSDQPPLWHDTCCELIQSLPDTIHHPLQNILDLSLPLHSPHALGSPERLAQALKEISQSGHLLYRRLQNILLYKELVDIEQDPQRLSIFRNHPGTSYTASIITDVAHVQSQTCDRMADLQLELEDAQVQLAPPKFKKIVEEIVKNAFDYSSVSTPICIKSYAHGKTFQLIIANKGKGFRAELLSDFDTHMQFARPSYLHEHEGLGLIISKLITELHGGELKVESIPEEFTKVSIFLPIT